jgi:ferric-dicitrate binding protein FerR (iron transport regulator)
MNDTDIPLLLSKYVDGELDATDTAKVEAHLASNSLWRSQLAVLKSMDTKTASAVHRFHQDRRIADAVVARIAASTNLIEKTHPSEISQQSSRPAPRRMGRATGTRFHWGRGIVRMTAAFILCAGMGWGWTEYQKITSGDSVAIKNEAETPLVLGAGTHEVIGKDGTRVLVRNGSRFEFISAREARLQGEAFFSVARNDVPFKVMMPNKRSIHVLGTHFDVNTDRTQFCIRVAEGHVRFSASEGNNTGAQPMDIRGGMQINTALQIEKIDPRKILLNWNTQTVNCVWKDFLPTWSQAAGGCDRSGITPVFGPDGLVSRPERFYDFPAESTGVWTPAIVDGAGRIVVLNIKGADLEKKSAVVWTLSTPQKSNTLMREWKMLAQNLAPVAPVIAPEGAILVAEEAGGIRALDANTGATLWSAPTPAPIRGLCVTPAGELIGVGDSYIYAWRSRDGQLLWTSCHIKEELSGAMAVTSSGTICAVANVSQLLLLQWDGSSYRKFSWPHLISYPPVVSNTGALFLQDQDGHVGRMDLVSGKIVETLLQHKTLAPPLANGLLSIGSGLEYIDRRIAAHFPTKESIVGFVQDGLGQVFVCYSRSILRLKPVDTSANSETGLLKDMEFSNIVRGTVLLGGIAVTPGQVILTTTKGVQIFE